MSLAPRMQSLDGSWSRRPLPVSFLSQMVAELPAGKLVDHVVGDLLSAQALESCVVWAPTPSAVSAKTLLEAERLGAAAPARAAFVAGVTSADTYLELAHAGRAGGLGDPEAAALLCNPLLGETDAIVQVRSPPASWEFRVATTCVLAAVDALLQGKRTLGPRVVFPSWSSNYLIVDLHNHWAWSSLSKVQQDRVYAEAPWYAKLWRWHEVANPADDSQLDRMLIGDEGHHGTLVVEADDFLVGEGSAGRAQVNRWLPSVLDSDSRAWKTLVFLDVKPTAGRHVGRRLYEVTGEDVGLWTVAVEMLESWNESLPAWLDAVAALH